MSPGARFTRRTLAWRALAGLFVAVLASAASPARAELPAELQGRPLVGVEVVGDVGATLSPEEIGATPGAPVDRALLRAAMTRLLTSERYADVQIDAEAAPGGVRLVITATPRLVVLRVQMTGNEVLDDDELRRAARLSEGDEIRPTELGELAERVMRAYADRGYASAQVVVTLRDTDDATRKVVVFGIAEGAPSRLRAVRFLGEAPPDEARDRVLGALSVSRGDVVDQRTVGDGARNAELLLREHGWLEAALGTPEITRDARGAVIVFRAHFGPRYEVVLRGHAPLSRDTVAGALSLRNERMGGSAGDRGLRDRVLDLYLRRGFLDARVEVLREAAQPGFARLVVAITPGAQRLVAGVRFPGASHLENTFLRGQIASYLDEDIPGSTLVYPVDSETVDALGASGRSVPRRREVRAPLVVEPARVYYAPTYTEALQHIAELYQAEGFLGVRVGPERVERRPDGRVDVVVPIEEGAQTLLYGVTVTGHELLGARALVEASGLRRGAPFGYLGLEEARVRMQALYRERGYLYARVEPEVRFSGDRTRAEVALRVTERFPVEVGGVVVRGLSLTDEDLVRARLALREGEVFRPSLARLSEERLLELGVFSGATVAVEDEDLPARTKRLVVTLTERKAQYLDTSLGISTGQGIRTAFEYGYRNLLGAAVATSLRVQLGYQFFLIDPIVQGYFDDLSLADRLERRVTLTVSAPYVRGLPGVRASLEASHIRHNERQFGYDKNGGVLSLSWRASRVFTLTQSGEVENNNLGLFGGAALEKLREDAAADPRLSRLLRIPSGLSTLVSARTTASIDLRDNPFTPTRGFFSTLSGEYARTLATEQLATGEQFFSNFFKVSLSASGYVPIASGVVLALQLRGGRIFAVDQRSATYPNRQYFLGGVDSLRGYLQDALIPEELATLLERDASGRASPGAVYRGGDAFMLARAELRFPIVGSLGGGAFLEAGNVWADARNFDPFDLRPTAGLGIRLATPVGPLAFDYGFVLLRRSLPVSSCEAVSSTSARLCAADVPFEPVGAFHFSIGLF